MWDKKLSRSLKFWNYILNSALLPTISTQHLLDMSNTRRKNGEYT